MYKSNHKDSELVLVVNIKHIISSMESNAHNSGTRQKHLLRFNRPLHGQVMSGIHVWQEGHYWPYPENIPLLLRPEEFITNWPRQGNVLPPEQWQINELAKEVDGVDNIEDVSYETFSSCSDTFFEIWENNVRYNLKSEINITTCEFGEDNEPCVVPVRYNDD